MSSGPTRGTSGKGTSHGAGPRSEKGTCQIRPGLSRHSDWAIGLLISHSLIQLVVSRTWQACCLRRKTVEECWDWKTSLRNVGIYGFGGLPGMMGVVVRAAAMPQG